MLFLVKVRIDTTKVRDLGAKLRGGAIDLTSMLWTYCHRDDPAVGISLWQVESAEDLDGKLLPLRPYYAEVLEITPAITSRDAQDRLTSAHVPRATPAPPGSR